ncbi:hypothetical protein SAMN05421642_102458 [Rhodococcoides kyotonense]|uniref:Uncharacterized protein n=1 Tax=Rhodococcoides kyotonense TaxID=398843 RepID=A0A239EN08_9NOCA|nr:hypothetical protein SAMN05421642_102458 [Rhodococcus kyotonensis]
MDFFAFLTTLFSTGSSSGSSALDTPAPPVILN